MMAEPPSMDSYCGAGDSSSGGSEGSFPFSSKVEGYDYDFEPPPDSRYECAICLMVLREPRQTPCGHRFCRDCILKWLRESHTRCPADNEEISENDLFPDNFAKREIQNFTVRCPNSKQGCDVLTTVKEVSVHQNVCPLALVPCPNQCTHVLLRKDLEQHMTQSCDRRSLPCPYCSASFLAVEYEMLKHMEERCPKAMVTCHFKLLGCTAQIMRSELDSHLSDNMVSHLNLLCHGVTQLFQYLHIPPLTGAVARDGVSGADMAGALSGMVPMIYQLSALRMEAIQPACTRESDVSSLREPQQGVSGWSVPSTLQSLRSPVSSASLDSAIPSLQTAQYPLNHSSSDPKSLMHGAPSVVGHEASVMSYTSDGRDNREVEVAGGGRQEWSGPSISTLQDEQKLVVHDQKLLELQVKMDNLERNYRQKMNELEGRICNGQFFWKIRNYSRYQHEAERGETTALHSQPFYTSPSGGYKLCVRANLNGVDSARGSHLSLFIHFMQGEYDDVLDWPFSGRIILSIMDQNDCCELRNHVAETLMAKPNLAAFQKPTTPRNHKGFGYMEFLPLSALKQSTYVKNDTLIIKVHVLPNG
ncbi:TNF receptor-associated factor 6-like isoform X2 [Babylonia areolata]|uniref:TNF receptor-associated factor 6-like isoform X2 n=1 Tax=Babylonia areolata TaxID=304850 RepID=UPI003FD3B6F3